MLLVGQLEGKRPLRRPRRRWVDNIKIDLSIDVAQDRDRWRALVNTVMYLLVCKDVGKVFSEWASQEGLSCTQYLHTSISS
jgi:hypothetical protein